MSMNTIDLRGIVGNPPQCFLKTHEGGEVSAIIDNGTGFNVGDIVYMKTDSENRPIPETVTEILERRLSKGDWSKITKPQMEWVKFKTERA